jgi:hypothetical protein
VSLFLLISLATKLPIHLAFSKKRLFKILHCIFNFINLVLSFPYIYSHWVYTF